MGNRRRIHMEELAKLISENGVGSVVMLLAEAAERLGYEKEYVDALYATDEVYEKHYGQSN